MPDAPNKFAYIRGPSPRRPAISASVRVGRASGRVPPDWPQLSHTRRRCVPFLRLRRTFRRPSGFLRRRNASSARCGAANCARASLAEAFACERGRGGAVGVDPRWRATEVFCARSRVKMVIGRTQMRRTELALVEALRVWGKLCIIWLERNCYLLNKVWLENVCTSVCLAMNEYRYVSASVTL